jgi:hypothetical protein
MVAVVLYFRIKPCGAELWESLLDSKPYIHHTNRRSIIVTFTADSYFRSAHGQ